MKSAKIYLTFLELSMNTENNTRLPSISPLEVKILELVGIANKNNERLSIKDLYENSGIATSSTIFLKIHSLEKKGWLYFEKTADVRRKQVKLTDEALKYFNKLGKALDKAVSMN
jgi:DNA-binding MarR family transcriptional regulator